MMMMILFKFLQNHRRVPPSLPKLLFRRLRSPNPQLLVPNLSEEMEIRELDLKAKVDELARSNRLLNIKHQQLLLKLLEMLC